MLKACKLSLLVCFFIVNLLCGYSLYDAMFGEYADQSVVAEIFSFERISFINVTIVIDLLLVIWWIIKILLSHSRNRAKRIN